MLPIVWSTQLAYVDPGSGSFLIQLLVGGLLAVSFALKSWRIRFVKWMRGFFKADSPKDHESGPESKN